MPKLAAELRVDLWRSGGSSEAGWSVLEVRKFSPLELQPLHASHHLSRDGRVLEKGKPKVFHLHLQLLLRTR